jgi:hypothetical protein
MTKLVPVAMVVSALAATAMGLASPAFSLDLGYGAVSPGVASLAQYGTPQSPGIGPNGDPRYGLHNESPGEVAGMGALGRRTHRVHRRSYYLTQYGTPQSPGIGPNGDPRYGLHNESPGEAAGMGALGR